MNAISFPLGQLTATPGAIEILNRSGQEPTFFLEKHLRLDQGVLDDEDHALNRTAVANGDRVFSAFNTLLGDKLWVITEADRSSTCILLPEEY